MLAGYLFKFIYLSFITYDTSVPNSLDVKLDVVDAKNPGITPANTLQINTHPNYYCGQSNDHTCSLMCDSTDITVDTTEAGLNFAKFNRYLCVLNKILRGEAMGIEIQAGLININIFVLFLIFIQWIVFTRDSYSNIYFLKFGLVKMDIIYHVLIEIMSNLGVYQCLECITDEITLIFGYFAVFISIITNFIDTIGIIIDNGSPSDKRDGIASNVFNFDGLNAKTSVFGLFEVVLVMLAIITLMDVIHGD